MEGRREGDGAKEKGRILNECREGDRDSEVGLSMCNNRCHCFYTSFSVSLTCGRSSSEQKEAKAECNAPPLMKIIRHESFRSNYVMMSKFIK